MVALIAEVQRRMDFSAIAPIRRGSRLAAACPPDEQRRNLHRITRGFGQRFEKNWSKKSGGLSRAPRRKPVRTVTWGLRSTLAVLSPSHDRRACSVGVRSLRQLECKNRGRLHVPCLQSRRPKSHHLSDKCLQRPAPPAADVEDTDAVLQPLIEARHQRQNVAF